MSAMSRTVIQTSGSARRGSGKALSGPVLQRLVPPPLDRRTDAHGFAIFGNGAAGDVEAFCPQQVHQRVVGQDFLRIFGCEDRKSVVEGKSVSVSVDRGGRRFIQKKKKKHIKH